ncbi:MAG: hypothetical protein ACR2H3_17000 [Acidimicrobiales bacterium]
MARGMAIDLTPCAVTGTFVCCGSVREVLILTDIALATFAVLFAVNALLDQPLLWPFYALAVLVGVGIIAVTLPEFVRYRADGLRRRRHRRHADRTGAERQRRR